MHTEHHQYIEKIQKITDNFIQDIEFEDPSIYKKIVHLSSDDRHLLGGIVSRFNIKDSERLVLEQRAQLNRILILIRKINTETLTLLNKVLDYLDINLNSLMDSDEAEFGLSIMESFANSDSKNHLLSHVELKMLISLIEEVDANKNGILDNRDKKELLDLLKDKKYTFERLKAKAQ